MIDYSLDSEHSVLTVLPKSALASDDFTELTKAVDAHITATGGLAGVIIDAPAFPGWRSLGGMVNHFRFIHNHHRNVKRVALVTDSNIGDVAQHLAAHFASADVRHFPHQQLEQARQWITDGASPDLSRAV
jgi:SpoIIAA-like